MKRIHLYFFLLLGLTLPTGCQNKDIDTEKPTIDLSIERAFPTNGDTLYFGETFRLRMQFSDNQELGSYSINIHNNFDHHSHSTEMDEVVLDSVKNPVNPYSLISDYAIPSGSQSYITDLEITLPDSNNNSRFDEGDYHFFISLTDMEGWSTQKGLSIKMRYR